MIAVLTSTIALTVMVSGCGQKEEAKAPPAPPAPTAQAPAPAPQPAPAPAPAPQASSPAPAPAPAPPAPVPSASPSGAKSIQTQMGMSGDVEVDVLKANVQEGILTVTLVYRNNGKEVVKLKQFGLDDVYFISETEKKKYHVLKDSKGEWIAAPVGRGMLGFEGGSAATPVVVSPGGKAIVWFKFPAPPENVTLVNLVVPDVIPFDKLPVSR